MIKIIADMILPPAMHRRLKRMALNKAKQKLEQYKKFSESEFTQILTESLSIKKGSVVFIHSSIDQLNIDFTVTRLIDLLKDVVGPQGTLVFPCVQFTGRAEDQLINPRFKFNVTKSITRMGLLPEYVRRRTGAVRSPHPTNSVVAIGPLAEELVADHISSIYPCDIQSPYYKMIQHQGVLVGLGVSSENLTFVHCVEDVLKERFPVKTRMDKVFQVPVTKANGELIVVKTLAAHPQIRWRDVSGFMRKYVDDDIGKDMKINGVNFFSFDSAHLFERMKDLAEQNVTIYNPWMMRLFGERPDHAVS